MASPRSRRPLDHLVLPVEDLETTRAPAHEPGLHHRRGGAPSLRHRECLRLLSPTAAISSRWRLPSARTAEAAARAGNVFVARDQAYRFRRGDTGFSAAVVGSKDAAADHARFIELGMSGGEMLEFSRPMKLARRLRSDPELQAGVHRRSAQPGFLRLRRRARQPCPQATARRWPRTTMASPASRKIILSEPNPTDFQYFIQELACNREVDANSFGMTVALEGAAITWV